MNIFENYLSIINQSITQNKEKLKLKNLESIKKTNLEVPPEQFNFDLSCNTALILAKSNKLKSKDLAFSIKNLLLDKVKHFKKIDVAGQGFLNIKLSNEAIIENIYGIIDNKKNYGSFKSNETYNIEFVSANPTGPMHVGHCRGAIFGDVLSNLLSFNGNKVTKEYYINDYGNQINNFVKSVFLRIREIKYKEKFEANEDLYPGLYIKDIAQEIINKNDNLKFDNFDKDNKLLKNFSLEEFMILIKKDLSKLGIYHDNFYSETKMIENNLVENAVKKLKDKKYVEEGYLDPPKGESIINWKKTKRLIFKSTIFGDDTNRAFAKKRWFVDLFC